MTHDHDRSRINSAHSKISVLRSEVDLQKGRVDAALEAVSEQAKKIEKLEKEIGNFRGLKGLASSLR